MVEFTSETIWFWLSVLGGFWLLILFIHYWSVQMLYFYFFMSLIRFLVIILYSRLSIFWHIVVHTTLFLSFYFCDISVMSSLSLLFHFWFCFSPPHPTPHFFFCPAKCLWILFTFSRLCLAKSSWILFIFSGFILYFWSFISAVIFVIFFLLLILGFVFIFLVSWYVKLGSPFIIFLVKLVK